MSGKSMKKMLLLAKLEAVPGTDIVPTAALNAILCRGLMPSLITAEFAERNNIKPYKGNDRKLAVGVHRRFQFEVEVAGSGVVATAPAWGILLQICGFAETITPATDVVYDLVSEGEPTASLYAFLDGVRFRLTYAKGTVSFKLDPKGIPYAAFDVIGQYSDATDTVLPNDADFTDFIAPKTMGKINTPTFSFYGIAARASAFSFDLANALVWRELFNFAAPASPDRKPRGTCVFELTTVAEKNWGTVVKDGTEGALQIVHGTVAGNIVTIDMPKIQIDQEPTLQSEDEIAMLSTSFGILPDTGNDEISIKFT